MHRVGRLIGRRFRLPAIAGGAILLSVLYAWFILQFPTLRTAQVVSLTGSGLPIDHERGNAYWVNIRSLTSGFGGDSMVTGPGSTVILFEDGRPLIGHSAHEDIRLGVGRFSHWGPGLYFSASDGSDPRSNGRRYTLQVPSRALRLRGWLLMALGLIGIVLCASLLVNLTLPASRERLLERLSRGQQAFNRVAARVPSSVWTGSIVLAACLLLIGASVSQSLILPMIGERTSLSLIPSGLMVVPDRDNAYVVDISSITGGIEGDSVASPRRSPLELFEDDKPLSPHSAHDDIRQGHGRFSHWGNALYFSAGDGSDPRSNGRRYTIRTFVYPGRLRHLLAQYLPSLCIAGFVLLALVTALPRRRKRFGRLGVRMAGASALATVLLLAPWMQGNIYGIMPDSLGYTQSPWEKEAVRTPAYYLFLSAVAGAKSVETEGWEIVHAKKYNMLLAANESSPIVRVVLAQKWVLIGALLVLYALLSSVVPPLGTALVVALIGDFLPKDLVNPRWAIGIGLAVALVFVVRFLRHRDWRSLTSVVGSLVVVPVACWSLGSTLLVPYEVHFIMTEALAMALHLVVAGCLVQYFANRQPLWLYGAALSTGLAMLVRPASVFTVAMVAMAAALAWLWGGKKSTRLAVLVGALVLTIAFPLLTASYRKVVLGFDFRYTPFAQWGMIEYALHVGRPEDADKMPDAISREFFLRSIAEVDRLETLANTKGAPGLTNNGILLYYAALPIAYQVLPEGERTEANRIQLFSKVARVVFLEHPGAVLRAFVENCRLAVTLSTRLNTPFPVLIFLAGAALLAIALPTDLARVGAILVLSHPVNMLVASGFEYPVPRVVESTEFLAAVGALILVWEALTYAGRGRTPRGAEAAAPDTAGTPQHLT